MKLTPRSKLSLCALGLCLPALLAAAIGRPARASPDTHEQVTLPRAGHEAAAPVSPGRAVALRSTAAASPPWVLRSLLVMAALGGLLFVVRRLRLQQLDGRPAADWVVRQRLALAPRTYLSVLERGPLRCTLFHGDGVLQVLSEDAGGGVATRPSSGARAPCRRALWRAAQRASRASHARGLPS